jgi:hypothetical protein
MISITPGYVADVAIKVWRHRYAMPGQRRVAPNKLAQRGSAAAVFIGDNREAVTATPQ